MDERFDPSQDLQFEPNNRRRSQTLVTQTECTYVEYKCSFLPLSPLDLFEIYRTTCSAQNEQFCHCRRKDELAAQVQCARARWAVGASSVVTAATSKFRAPHYNVQSIHDSPKLACSVHSLSNPRRHDLNRGITEFLHHRPNQRLSQAPVAPSRGSTKPDRQLYPRPKHHLPPCLSHCRTKRLPSSAR